MSIQIEQLTKQYGEQKAVNAISFSIAKGEIVGFLGPNGAGKSTTMKMITGYLPPTSGDILVNGLSVAKQPLVTKKMVGYLPEHNPLYKDMYIKEYLDFVGQAHGIKKRKDRIQWLIETTGLSKEQHKKIGQLSKGYRQRVGIAQAIFHDPNILILDEPTTGLDPNQLIEIRQLIQTLGQDKTVILSTHILKEVEAICSRAIIIHNGQIVADEAINNLNNSPYIGTNVVFSESIAPSEIIALPHHLSHKSEDRINWTILSSADNRAEIFELANRNAVKILELRPIVEDLETTFQTLTMS